MAETEERPGLPHFEGKLILCINELQRTFRGGMWFDMKKSAENVNRLYFKKLIIRVKIQE